MHGDGVENRSAGRCSSAGQVLKNTVKKGSNNRSLR